jgi:glycosyltransferase involved in cell wall biosynthesis
VKISILTPVRNYLEYLPDALDSVNLQRGSMPGDIEVEHIVMDGASTDGTAEYLASRTDLVWHSEPDRGQSDALNKALALATGDWIGWLNADEFYLPNTLRILGEELSSTNADVVYGDYCEVTSDGRFSRAVIGNPFRGSLIRWRGTVIPTCASFIRADVLRRMTFDSDLRFVMDWDLWLGLLASGASFCHVPMLLSAFRLHSGQMTARPDFRGSPEFDRVRERYDLKPMPPIELILRGWHDGQHKLLKVTSGAIRRERLLAREFMGGDLRWTDARTGRGTVATELQSRACELGGMRTSERAG